MRPAVWLPPLLIILAAAVLALFSHQENEHAQREDFLRETRTIEARLDEELCDYELLLRSGLSLLSNVSAPSMAQWRAMTHSLGPHQHLPAAQAIAFSPVLRAADVPRHERLRRAETPGYTVWPKDPARTEVCPVSLIEPLDERNRRAIGFDLYSDPVRKAAIDAARDSGETRMSGRVTLMQEDPGDPRPGSLLYVPVFRTGAPRDTVAERRAALVGFVSCPFRMERLMTTILGDHGKGLGVSLYDGPPDQPGTLLFRRPTPGRPWFVHTGALSVFGRTWTFRIESPAQPLLSPWRREPLTLLLLGGLLAAAVYVVVRSIDATRRRAEELAGQMTAELSRSEAYNRAVFQRASMAIGVAGADGLLRDANPALLEMLGYGREELLGRHWLEITHPDHHAEHLDLDRQAREGALDSYQLDERLLHRDGRAVWVHLNIGVSRDADGNAEMYIGAAKDISASMAAQEARTERQEIHEAMFEHNRSVCLLVDPHSATIVDANHAAATYYGYPREELAGMAISRINPMPGADLINRMAEAGRTGGVFSFIHRLAGGELRNVEVHSGPFVVGGHTLLLSNVHDVTDRVRAEAALSESRERFQNLVESMDQGVILCDENDRVTYVNPAFARLMGSATDVLVGMDGAELLVPDEQQARRKRREERRQGSREPYETRLRPATGGERLVRVLPFPLYGPEGRFLGACGLVADITAQHAAQEAERQRQVRRTALLRLHEMNHANRQELVDFALEHVLLMTGSEMGFICSYDEGTRRFSRFTWSDPALWACRAADMSAGYSLDRAGLWADAVRLREPLMLNDFDAPHPSRRGLPEGHAPLARFLCVPVISLGQVRGMVAVANKAQPYTDEDCAQLRLFMEALWGILDRQEAERHLREVTERFQLAVRAGRIGLWDWDITTGLTHFDPVMESLFALSSLPRTGTSEDWLCRVHPEDRPRVRQALDQARADGGRFEMSFRVLRPGAGMIHVEAWAVCHLSPGGAPSRMVGVNVDVTRLRDAEHRLAQGHQFLQNLVDTLPVPFVAKDAQGRYLLVNKSFATLYGRTKGDILGHTMPEFCDEIAARHHAEQDARLLSGPPGEPLQYEVEYAAPGGRPRHWLVFKSLLDLPEGGPGLASIALDITDRKQTLLALREERRRLEDVIEGSSAGTWEWNLATGEAQVNSRWAEILGYRPEELAPITVNTWRGLLHPDDAPLALDTLERHLECVSPMFDVECRLLGKGGRPVWVHQRGRVFKRADDGAPLLMSGVLNDISQRKSAEERLELVARFPVENPNPVLRAEASGQLLFANPAADPLLRDWRQGMGGQLPPELREVAAHALATGKAVDTERSYASGIYMFRVSPFGEKGYANIYAVDVTERKTAELALRQSEHRNRELAVLLRLMCDNVPDLIWAKDLEGRYLFANKAVCEQLLGISDTQAALGRTDRDFALGAGHPPQAEDAPQAGDASARIVGGGQEGQFEESGVFRGVRRAFDVRKAPFVNDQGQVIGTVGSARDITSRKEAEDALTRSEERFRTMAQVSPVGIFQADAGGRCVYVNDQWSVISGRPKAEGMGLGWLGMLEPGCRKTVVRGLRNTARTGIDFATELRFRDTGSGAGWVLARAAAWRDAEGRLIGIVGALTDVSGLKRAEEQLRLAKAQAEAATEAKAMFLANMSHEIRTPLAGAITATRLLAQTRLDDEQKRLADMAGLSGQSLLNVVNDILDYSKIDAKRLVLRRESFSLRALVEEVCGPLRLQAAERGLGLFARITPESPDTLLGDEGRLGQVLHNLLGNAVKFTETGEVRLTAAALPDDSSVGGQPAQDTAPGRADGALLQISVSDTGIGIDPEYLPNIFDSFSQADSSFAKRHAGTGLGLAICKSLVERMGGTIRVESAPGQGSTFSFTVRLQLDQRPGARTEALPGSRTSPPAEQPPTHPQGLKVLLAEDNLIGRVLMEHLLTAMGHTTVSVADGAEALAALARERFDLVLMDVQMPRLDGVAATRRIRRGAAGEAARNVPVVALTAYASADDRIRFMEAGMNGVVSKPAGEAVLRAAMAQAVETAAGKDDAPARPAEASAPGEASTAGGEEAPLPPRMDRAYLERGFAHHGALLRNMLRQMAETTLPELLPGLRAILDSLPRDDASRAEALSRGRALAHRARGALAAVGAALAAHHAARAEAAARKGDAALFAAAAGPLLAEMEFLAAHLERGLPWGHLAPDPQPEAQAKHPHARKEDIPS